MNGILKTGLIGVAFLLCAGAWAQETVKTDTLADKMLLYQCNNGGWPKQLHDKSVVRYDLPLTPVLLEKIKATSPLHATIDNKATTREINALVSAFRQTANPAYLKAAEKGIDYLLQAQYANGGWPQYYPDKSLYRAEITFNDDAMVNVLLVMLHIVKGQQGFELVDPSYKSKAADALKRGVDCILKTQVIQQGRPVIWAAQYDENTLIPAKARAFEPASLSTSESVGIIRLLMKLDQPSAAVKKAIKHAIDWFEAHQIKGFRFDKSGDGGNALIADHAAVCWARFYDLQTNRPLFGDRDGSVKYDLTEISAERRNGYAWYGDFAYKLLTTEYPKWAKKHL